MNSNNFEKKSAGWHLKNFNVLKFDCFGELWYFPRVISWNQRFWILFASKVYVYLLLWIQTIKISSEIKDLEILLYLKLCAFSKYKSKEISYLCYFGFLLFNLERAKLDFVRRSENLPFFSFCLVSWLHESLKNPNLKKLLFLDHSYDLKLLDICVKIRFEMFSINLLFSNYWNPWKVFYLPGVMGFQPHEYVLIKRIIRNLKRYFKIITHLLPPFLHKKS